jgi:hypothetical protein
MEQTECLRPVHLRHALPFGGLGLKLDAVFDRAESLRFRSARPRAGRVRWRAAPESAGLSGYELLLRLGREIRGC